MAEIHGGGVTHIDEIARQNAEKQRQEQIAAANRESARVAAENAVRERAQSQGAVTKRIIQNGR